MKLLKILLPLSALSLGAMVQQSSDMSQFLASKEIALDLGSEVPEKYKDFLDAAQRAGCSLCGKTDSKENNRLNLLLVLFDPFTKQMRLAAHRKCYKNYLPDTVKSYIVLLNEKYPGVNQKAILLANELSEVLKKANEKFGVKNFEQLSTKGGGDELLEEFFEEKSLKLQGITD